MKLLKHPRTGQPDLTGTLSFVVTIAACVKFLAEGVTFTLGGHVIQLGHADSAIYLAVLGSVLGAHSYINTKPNTINSIKQDGDPSGGS